MKKIPTLLIALILVGCSSTPQAEKPPKHMKRVEFVSYDSTKRSMSPAIEVLNQPPARKHKVIALITCEGAYHEEIVMTKAIIYKARELGADAAIMLDANSVITGSGSMYGHHTGGRSLFRANAIVFEKE